jgi:poly-gamma-glutamate synthesis protein (capsule biosynthesis protein)
MAASGCAGTTGSALETASPTADPGGAGVAAGAIGVGTPDSSADEPRPRHTSSRTITIAFGGDVSFSGLEAALSTDPASVLSAVAPTLSGADLAIVNLETALATGGSPEPKAFNFRAPPAALDALSAAGVDAVTMANNHGMDFGADGLAESLALRGTSRADHGVAIVGIGADEDDAYAPFVTEVDGHVVGLIGANDVFDDALQSRWTAGPSRAGLASARSGDRQERLLAEVRDLRDQVDTLVVYLHMGVEKQTCPSDRQIELADALHLAGADVVVGSHAHRLQGAGFRSGGFVAFGMGNYVFDAPSSESRKSATLLVRATGEQVAGFEWRPARIEGNVPVPLDGSTATSALSELDQLAACAGLDPTPAETAAADTTSSAP